MAYSGPGDEEHRCDHERACQSALRRASAMMPKLKTLILRLLDEHRVMTIATNRPDGWPQATMVGYVNDGFLLYCFVARNAQKYANILRDPRISIAIGSDAPNPVDIKGLSLAAKATEVTDASEFDYAAKLRLKRYPEYAALPRPTSKADALLRISPQPPRADIALLRIAPEIISVLDYAKGFGHSDLVTFSERDLDVHIQSLRHRWNDDAEAGRSATDVSPTPGTGRS
jgi:general stress protein 26